MSDERHTETEYMLTTFDNPFDPFEQYVEWSLFDNEHSYNTSGYLARIVSQYLEDDMTQREKDEVIEKAIDEIILYDFRNIYKKVSKTTEIVEPLDMVTV